MVKFRPANTALAENVFRSCRVHITSSKCVLDISPVFAEIKLCKNDCQYNEFAFGILANIRLKNRMTVGLLTSGRETVRMYKGIERHGTHRAHEVLAIMGCQP